MTSFWRAFRAQAKAETVQTLRFMAGSDKVCCVGAVGSRSDFEIAQSESDSPLRRHPTQGLLQAGQAPIIPPFRAPHGTDQSAQFVTVRRGAAEVRARVSGSLQKATA